MVKKLGKKSFHPSNPKNLQKLYAAEEKKKADEKKKAELEEQFEDAYYARGSLRADSPKNAPTRSSPRLAERKKLR